MAGEAQRALDLLTQVNDIGFPEFTSDLVSSTFETLTSSAITQLQAYSELVESVAKTLEQYTIDTLGADPAGTGSASVQVRNDWINENLLDPELATFDSGAGTYTVPLASRSAVVQLFAGITVDGNSIEESLEGDEESTITATALHDFVGAKLQGEVEAQQNLLVTILRLGMQKLVVTDGKIRTKLTFNVKATETRFSSSSAVSTRSRGLNVGGRFASRIFGISASYGSRRVQVNVTNENSSGVINVDAEIVGEVQICFRSETFPPVDPPALATPSENASVSGEQGILPASTQKKAATKSRKSAKA